MKNLLSQESSISRLSRNEKLRPECLYILSSESISKTLYFESKKDILFAHRLISRHLRNILEVVSYLFTPDGWVMVVKIKNEDSIAGYLKEKKKNRSRKGFDISREISEHLRYMISGLAKAINARTGRKGTLVSRTFSRYMCIDIESANAVIEKLENAEYSLSRQKHRYKASLRYWDVEGQFQERACVFLSSGGRSIGVEKGLGGSNLLYLHRISKNVLHSLIEKTITTHFKRIHNKKQPFPFKKITHSA